MQKVSVSCGWYGLEFVSCNFFLFSGLLLSLKVRTELFNQHTVRGIHFLEFSSTLSLNGTNIINFKHRQTDRAWERDIGIHLLIFAHSRDIFRKWITFLAFLFIFTDLMSNCTGLSDFLSFGAIIFLKLSKSDRFNYKLGLKMQKQIYKNRGDTVSRAICYSLDIRCRSVAFCFADRHICALCFALAPKDPVREFLSLSISFT